MKFYFFFALILITSVANASRYLAYLGGSGDPAGATTIFDNNIAPIARYTRQSLSNSSISFNGGHATTESILQQQFAGRSVSNFTSTAYETLISRYENEIKSGMIKPGDQLLIIIDSHGAVRIKGNTTHAISTGKKSAVDLNSLQGSELVSLDRMLNLSKLAEQNGIKLGIIDTSCHSGASLPLANSKTCVITGTGPMSFAYSGTNPTVFTNRLLNGMVSGKNLESVYLDARAGSTDLGFPMISTTEGKTAQNQLYPLLQKYLVYKQEKHDKFSDEILSTVKDQTCQQENTEFEKLITLSRQMESVTSGLNLENFRNALIEYHDYRRSIQDAYRRAGVHRLKEIKEICGAPLDGIVCNPLSVESIIAIDVDARLEYNQSKLRSAKTEKERADYRQWIIYFKNMKIAKTEILRVNPGITQYATTLSNFPNIQDRTVRLANKVALESKKAYSALYRPSPATNACRNFVL